MTARRPYDSPVRRQQVAETRERIVAAGSELVHGFSSWDWQGLTVRAVAERAGVNERTVYRHFANERELHDAVMRRLEEEAGIDVEALELADLGDVTRRMFAYLSSFSVASRPLRDPTFVDIDQRRRDALLAAVVRRTDGWDEDERVMAAAVLDVMWCIPTYERLVSAWDLDADQASTAIGWVIDLLEQAIKEGRSPGR